MAKGPANPDRRGRSSSIRLVLNNTRPVRALDFGRLFTVLAADYKKVTNGRTLVVTRLESGSIWVWLHDSYNAIEPYGKAALEAAKAAKGLREFAGTLKALLKPTNKEPAKSIVQPIGLKSARSILKLAVNSGANVDFEYVGTDGDQLNFKISREQAITRQAQLKDLGAKASASASAKATNAIPRRILTAEFERLVHSMPEGDIAALEAVETLVRSLQGRGMDYVLLEAAAELETQGHSDLARTIRNALRPPGETTQNLLT